MRRVSPLPALLALLLLALGACAADPPADRGVGGQTTTTTTPDPTTAPSSTAKPAATRQRAAPKGVAAPADRRPAPALRVTAFDGRTVTLGAFRGMPVVVNFFESWWPQCRAEQPGLGQVARELEGEAGFVGVSFHDTVAAGRAYQRQFDVPYPLANDASGRTWAAWGVPYQPVTVVVDNRGRVARRFDGEVTPEQLRPVLAYLIGE